MQIRRDIYLDRLIARKRNGMAKVITGVRRSGKSFLMNELFYQHLIGHGVDKSHIIRFAFDSADDLAKIQENPVQLALEKRKVDPLKFCNYIDQQIRTEGEYYLLLDEIQLMDAFESVVNSYLRDSRLDLYVTGSNSKFLSSDIITEFRGRGDEVRIYPFRFSEFVTGFNGEKWEAWNEFLLYGGLPQILEMATQEQKVSFLKTVFQKVYVDDIVSRNHLRGDETLNTLCDCLASSTGSLTNPKKLADTFVSAGYKAVSDKTISTYIEYMKEAFLIEQAKRYNVKGKVYIGSPYKYYFCDTGLRNVRLSFRQFEPSHLMENVIYNELLSRGLEVDVGVVAHDEKDRNGHITRKQLEIDFVVNHGNQRYYIQSAYAIPDQEKMRQEQASLIHVPDSFRKIIVTNDPGPLWRNEKGITIMGIFDFLLHDNSLDL